MTLKPLAAAVALASCGLAADPAAAASHHTLGGDVAAAHFTASLDCLTPAARALFGRIEAHFGALQVLSTCRPGARVAGTGEISRHSSGNAIDFLAGGRKAEVVNWLIANHTSGGTMTYTDADHIHVDIGPHWVILAGRKILP